MTCFPDSSPAATLLSVFASHPCWLYISQFCCSLPVKLSRLFLVLMSLILALLLLWMTCFCLALFLFFWLLCRFQFVFCSSIGIYVCQSHTFVVVLGIVSWVANTHWRLWRSIVRNLNTSTDKFVCYNNCVAFRSWVQLHGTVKIACRKTYTANYEYTLYQVDCRSIIRLFSTRTAHASPITGGLPNLERVSMLTQSPVGK